MKEPNHHDVWKHSQYPRGRTMVKIPKSRAVKKPGQWAHTARPNIFDEVSRDISDGLGCCWREHIEDQRFGLLSWQRSIFFITYAYEPTHYIGKANLQEAERHISILATSCQSPHMTSTLAHFRSVLLLQVYSHQPSNNHGDYLRLNFMSSV